VGKPCPVCNKPYLVEKNTKREGRFLSCADRQCGYKEPLD